MTNKKDEKKKRRDIKLEEVMKEQFGADETRWIGGETASEMLGTSEVENKSYVILEAWWD